MTFCNCEAVACCTPRTPTLRGLGTHMPRPHDKHMLVANREENQKNEVVQAMRTLVIELETSRDGMEQRLHSQLKIMDGRLDRLARHVDVLENMTPFPAEDVERDSKMFSEGLTGLTEEIKGSTTTTATRKSMRFSARASKRSSKGSKEKSNGVSSKTADAIKSVTSIKSKLAKQSSALSRRTVQPPADCWEALVESSYFDGVCAGVVILNSLLVGVQINHEAVNDNEEQIYNIIEYICTVFFTIELFIRMAARKRYFCAAAERYWAAFDVLLVGMSWVDIGLELAFEASGGMPGPGASIGKILKMARMARIMRILRMVRFLTRIRIMATLIIGSMVSLFWLMVLLLTVMYVFAIVLTQGATMWTKPGEGFTPPTTDAHYNDVRLYYGSVPKTIYTLFMSMTGGVSWGEPADVTHAFGYLYFCIFTCYIFFAIFSVMNIVTGVFVDGAIQQAESDRSMVMQKHQEERLEISKTLEDILEKLDINESGHLDREEWNLIADDPTIHAVFSGMQIDLHEAEDLYDLLDVDGDGHVSIREFVDGTFRLKGWAKAIDVERLNVRATHMLRKTEELHERVDLFMKSVQNLAKRSTTRRSMNTVRHC